MVEYLQSTFPENKYRLFTTKTQVSPRTKPFLDANNFKVVSPESKSVLWRSYGMVREPSFAELDIYHGLSHELPFSIRKFKGKKVVTIHDLIFKYDPKDYHFLDRIVYDVKFKFACQVADEIIAISQQTKNDIIQYYGISPDKINIVYQSCDPIFRKQISGLEIQNVLEKYDLPEDYFLYVGSIISRKNLEGVIRALQKLPKSLRIPLVVIGNGKKYRKKIISLIYQLSMQDMVIWKSPEFTDFAPIYKKAKALILPSYFEGFGIPILEAMSTGTPVITSDQSSLAEVSGSAAILVDPSSTDQIKEAMEAVLTDDNLAQERSVAGLKRSKEFDPVKIAQQVMEIYLR